MNSTMCKHGVTHTHTSTPQREVELAAPQLPHVCPLVYCKRTFKAKATLAVDHSQETFPCQTSCQTSSHFEIEA